MDASIWSFRVTVSVGIVMILFMVSVLGLELGLECPWEECRAATDGFTVARTVYTANGLRYSQTLSVTARCACRVFRADNSEATDDGSRPPKKRCHDSHTAVSAVHGHHRRVQRIRG